VQSATKIADALGTTLNYLVKDRKYEQIDNDMLKKIKAIYELDSDTKAHIFVGIDILLKLLNLKVLLSCSFVSIYKTKHCIKKQNPSQNARDFVLSATRYNRAGAVHQQGLYCYKEIS
jgi:hypothetical protein